MSEALNEQLSALVDDELDSAELPLLMRQLSGSEPLCGTLERYYLMRDAVRRELPVNGFSCLADRVASAIEEEPLHTGRKRRGPSGQALRPAAGLAIAASVAVLAVSLWPGGSTTTSSPPQSAPVATGIGSSILELTGQSGAMRVSAGAAGDGGVATRSQRASTAGQEWDRLDPRVQHLLNSYIVDHSEHAGSAQLGGMINYARIAGQAPKEQ